MTTAPATAPPSAAHAIPGAFSDPYRWAILTVAVLAQTTASIVSQGIYTLVPFLQAAFHLNQAQAALSVSAVNAGQMMSMLLMGWLIDKYGERGVVSITMLAMGSAAVCASLAPHYSVLLVCLLLLGASYASVQPGGTKAMIRWFAPRQRGMATGIRQAGLPLGTALAAMLLPVLASEHGWQRAILLQGLIGIVGAAAFAFFYRRADSAASQTVTAPPNPLQLIREVSAYKALWPVMLAGVAMVTFQYTFATHILTFLNQRFGMSVVAAGLLYSVSQWVGIAGRIGLAWISDHFWPDRRMRSLVVTMLICVLVTMALVAVPASAPTWVLVALFVVVGVFGVGWYPLYLLQVAEMAPKAAVASTISFSMTMNMAAISVVPPLFGLIVDGASYTWAWLALAAGVLLGVINLRRGSAQAEAARREGR
jgi:MFS family permease